MRIIVTGKYRLVHDEEEVYNALQQMFMYFAGDGSTQYVINLWIHKSFGTQFAYGENLIAPCSRVHDNFTMGVNRKILINLIYIFIQDPCKRALIIYYLPIIDMYFLNFLFKRKMVCF